MSTVKEKKSFGQKIAGNCSALGNFIYRKETNSDGDEVVLIIGRNGKSWAKIGLFYVCFYGFLAGFFAAMLTVFLQTINVPGIGSNGGPKYVEMLAADSILFKAAPGLNLVNPISSYKKSELDAWKKTTEDYLKGFDAGEADRKCSNKTDGYSKEEFFSENPTKFCKFVTDQIKDECNGGSTDYGYEAGKPCLFIQINKVFGWIPKGSDANRQYLKLKCRDVKNKVDLQTVPADGYLINAFPFQGQSGYQTPAVAVKPDLTNDAEIQCELVGDGIKPSDSYQPKRAYGKISIEVGKKDYA